MKEEEIKKLEAIVFENMESGSDGWKSVYTFEQVMKGLKIAYLKGITEYTIWADYVPKGDKICDDYQEELEQLTK